ncbi:hypothetical protein ABZY14_36935 [Streptomyces sp. NPDC006617]
MSRVLNQPRSDGFADSTVLPGPVFSRVLFILTVGIPRPWTAL